MTVTVNISIHKSKIQTLAIKSSQGNPQDFFHSILYESKFPGEKVNTEPLCTIIPSFLSGEDLIWGELSLSLPHGFGPNVVLLCVVRKDKHFQTSSKYHGMNLSLARLAFKRLVRKDDVLSEVRNCLLRVAFTKFDCFNQRKWFLLAGEVKKFFWTPRWR